MTSRRNSLIGGSVGTLLSGGWIVFQSVTSARDFPDDAKWFAKIMADPPFYAPWILLGACTIFLAWVFWESSDNELSNAGQSTTGKNSPIGSGSGFVAGTVAGPAIYAPNSTWHNGVPVPTRAPVPEPVERTHGTLVDHSQRQLAPKPSVPFRAVFVRLVKIHGPLPSENELVARNKVLKKISLVILDAIVENDMSVWGRRGAVARQKIPITELSRSQLTAPAGELLVRNYDNPNQPTRYMDLYFDGSQIEEVWPRE